MITYLLLGIALGIILESFYINVLLPVIQIKLEFHRIKATDLATQYALHTEESTFDFYRKYPEARPEPEFKENTNVMGFQIDSCEDEDDWEDEEPMGFKIK